MRQVNLGLWVGLFLFGWVNVVEAQSLSPAPVIDSPASFARDRGRPVVADWLPVATPVAQTWTVDLELGLPTGLRAQHCLGDNMGRDWLVEGFAGFELIFP